MKKKYLALALLSLNLLVWPLGCKPQAPASSEHNPSSTQVQAQVQPQASAGETQAGGRFDLAFKGSETVPAFKLEFEGRIVDNEILKGKTTVLSIGATWCPDCRKEYKILQALADQYKGDEAVQFVTILAVDGVKQTRENAQEYFQEEGLTLPMYFARSSQIRESFQVDFIPTLMVIGPDGKVLEIAKDKDGSSIYYFIEAGTQEEIQALIEKGKALTKS